MSDTHRRPGPDRGVSPRNVCPATGPARLSYGRARALLDQRTTPRGPGTGWDLPEYRHSGLTHLGEAGASLLMPMPKSPHKKPAPSATRWIPLARLAGIVGRLSSPMPHA
ncbi:hypothetical protein ACFV8T_22235 [Streptomyces sp. NPDC059832]|uniref:hypothetical protein n=1 Tax=Streptomyces sp. NPDC059832 TaxID=3346966 RepID=UPI003660AF33